MSFLPVAEARARILDLVTPVGTEEAALPDLAGRVLAADVVAARAQPPFTTSAMDGYAVRAAEATAGAVLALAGEAAAGHGSGLVLPPGEAVRIFTGAPMPEGADAVLIQENAETSGDAVTVREAPEPGGWVRPAGMDFAAGFRLTAPRRLTARDVALIAAMNAPRAVVARRPVVALIPTGDELVEPGTEPGPAAIVTSNSYGLAAMLSRWGAVPRLCPVARDTPESLAAALEAAEGADMVVTLGGASVGDHDLVASVFAEHGLERAFWRIAMRPGKPLMAGRIGGRLMLGLPGNPVSAMICGRLFVVPAVERAMGLPGDPPRTRPMRLAEALGPNGPREHYMRARLRGDEDREAAVADRRQDSNLLGVLAAADGLIVRPPHDPAREAGSEVPWIDLD